MQKSASLYESAVDTYKIILPIHQHRRQWQLQAECHKDLADLCGKVVEEEKATMRLFSNFYRVAFYAPADLLGEEVAGQEFVYKSDSAIRVSDFTERLTVCD